MTIERAIDALSKRALKDERVILGRPAKAEAIRAAESALGLTFPTDLVTWYARVGTVIIDHEPICGVETVEPTRAVAQRTMNHLKIDNPGTPLTVAALRRIEAWFGQPLPTSYVAFLRRVNGGTPRPGGFPIQGLANNPSGAIDSLYGIETGRSYDDLQDSIESLANRIPPELAIPIAADAGGNQIILSLAFREVGAVYYWDWYARSARLEKRTYFIAQSYDAFLESLFEPPEFVDDPSRPMTPTLPDWSVGAEPAPPARRARRRR